MTLVRYTGLALALFVSACGAQAEEIGREHYRIPRENLLMNTFAGEYVRFVYGRTVPEGRNEVGLIFTGTEVADAIPGFRSRTQGYPGLVDASPSVVVSLADETSNFDEMLAQHVARLDPSQGFVPFGESGFYRPKTDDNLFQLALQNGSWERGDLLPPSCRTSQAADGGTYHSCSFRLRRDGLEYGFSLSGENVAYVDEYADFVRAKLDSWKVAQTN